MAALAPAQDPAALVEAFADTTARYPAYEALVALGPAALPAVRRGLQDDNWQIRRWSAICLDRIGDAAALQDLVPLLQDPKSQVRMWAVHALSCDHCKADASCPVDAVPLLIQRIERDESIRVRRMATIMLATDHLDARATGVFERILRVESDRKLRLHAQDGLTRLRRGESPPRSTA